MGQTILPLQETSLDVTSKQKALVQEALGLDNVVKTLNATPEEVYTIKYKEV